MRFAQRCVLLLSVASRLTEDSVAVTQARHLVSSMMQGAERQPSGERMFVHACVGLAVFL